jgi:hypothetical protein
MCSQPAPSYPVQQTPYGVPAQPSPIREDQTHHGSYGVGAETPSHLNTRVCPTQQYPAPSGTTAQTPTTYGGASTAPIISVYQQMRRPSPGHIEVIVPQGAYGGSILIITEPSNGRVFQVIVPQGLQPGMKFICDISWQGYEQAPKQQSMGTTRRNSDNRFRASLLGMFWCCLCCGS